MAPKYNIGQKVTIKPVGTQSLSARDSGLEQYAGQSGTVIDYYWISLGGGARSFYVYTVRVGTEDEEITLHEDELEKYIE
jgi:hypothetical protein